MELSKHNLELFTNFFLGNTEELDKKDDDFKNLFLSYASDNNSSTIRELVTMYYLGYDSFSQKHGADGIDKSTGSLKEVKPKYLSLGKKLSGSGNFNDMTLELLEKKKDFDIICSLFYETKLVYIIEFPLSEIYEKLKIPIINAKLGKRVVCHFGWNDYKNANLKIHYLNEELISTCLSKGYTKLLKSKKTK
jgi:hypothetical protein